MDYQSHRKIIAEADEDRVQEIKRCECACMCNAPLTQVEKDFYERNLDVRPRNLCGRCWREMTA